MEIISNSDCVKSYDYTSNDITDTMICAQGTADGNIQGACQGDSGGPLVCQSYEDEVQATAPEATGSQLEPLARSWDTARSAEGTVAAAYCRDSRAGSDRPAEQDAVGRNRFADGDNANPCPEPDAGIWICSLTVTMQIRSGQG